MNLRNIFIAGLSVLALSACNDYLEVDAPSKNLPTDVFSDTRAMQRALNGVYATMLSSNIFGDKAINDFCLNSDVDFKSNSSDNLGGGKPCRFDCKPSDSNIKSAWADLYHGIEVCNLFIEGAEGSPAYDEANPDAEILQMIGEAKVARAMFYHELIWMFGDVPFSSKSSQTTETMIYPITDRIEILDFLIKDIAAVADDMMDPSQISERTERISRQAAYAMIARLAMTAGGWYLAPDGESYGKMVQSPKAPEFYKIAREYAKKVIDSNVHHLNKQFYKVFVDECNNVVASDDDPIFEIPFAKESTGNIGYIHGPKMDQYEGQTPHPYGKASASAKLNSFYRFMFDEDDERRDYVNQLFRYTADGSEYTCRLDNSYSVQNGKWSKLWVNGGLGNITEGNTGINYPYLRYADVLLMFAEADNEIEGHPTDAAIQAVRQVRERAFRNTNPIKAESFPCGNYEEFKKAILDERKFEFAGENMRWRDLVRNNMYNLEVYWTFFRNYYMAEDQGNIEIVALRDFDNNEAYDNLPRTIYNLRTCDNSYKQKHNNPNFSAWDGQRILSEAQFPNSDMKICWAINPYKSMKPAEFNEIKKEYDKITVTDWQQEEYFPWVDGDGNIRNEIRYSMRGYIYMTDMGMLRIIRNGNEENPPTPSVDLTANDLPVVRYILPIPSSEIARSQGKYTNKYGYTDN